MKFSSILLVLTVVPRLARAGSIWCQDGTLSPGGGICCGPCDGQCGGSGCGTRPGGHTQCCGGSITNSGTECSTATDVACIIPDLGPELVIDVTGTPGSAQTSWSFSGSSMVLGGDITIDDDDGDGVSSGWTIGPTAYNGSDIEFDFVTTMATMSDDTTTYDILGLGAGGRFGFAIDDSTASMPEYNFPVGTVLSFSGAGVASVDINQIIPGTTMARDWETLSTPQGKLPVTFNALVLPSSGNTCSFVKVGDGTCLSDASNDLDFCKYSTTYATDAQDLCLNDIECVGMTIFKDGASNLLSIGNHYSNGQLPTTCPGDSNEVITRDDSFSGVGCPVQVDDAVDNECFRKECATPHIQGSATCGGDPHLSTWQDDHFNFNGQCDITFVSSKTFQKGQGLDIHVRTLLESFYSIVSAVAIKVGPKIFEFNHETVGAPKYFVDGKQLAELPYEDDQFKATSYHVHNEDHNRLVQIINIELAGGQASLHITVMDQWVHLNVKATNILDSKGITGSFPDGKMLARDGLTDLSHDRNAYGLEWQVQEDEPKLFHSIPEGHPQAPQATCKMPLEDAHKYLRTRDSELYNMAIQACKQEGLTGLDLEDCIFDVSVMNNPKIAAAWWAAEKAEE